MTGNVYMKAGFRCLWAILFWVAATGIAHAEVGAEIATFGSNAFKVLSAKNYGQMEKLFHPLLDSYAKKKSTAEELFVHFNIFSMMTEVELELDGWVSAYPKSYAARLARGIYFVEEAWRKRGMLMGNRTSDEQYADFRKYLAKSKADLEASVVLYERPMESYRYLIRVAKGQDSNEERRLFDLAIKLDPTALGPYLEFLDAITPRWGGKKERMEALLNEGRKSPMSARDKTRLEGRYYLAMAQDARLHKDYRAGSDYFYKGYQATGEENALLFSAEIAIDAEDTQLAIVRLDELIKQFPKSANGYDYRAKVYEYKLNDAVHAIPDYIKAAELGSSWSQNHIGWLYMNGIQVPVDHTKARKYFNLAAKQGNKTAEENLAILDKHEGRK